MTDLDEFQIPAVDYPGNVLLVAGPGAGKTRTVAAKIERLLQEGTPLSDIFCVSFSNEAAGELLRRVPRLEGRVKTIHAFGYSLLRERFRVIDMKASPDTMDARKKVMAEFLVGELPLFWTEVWRDLDLRASVSKLLSAIDQYKSTPDRWTEEEPDYLRYYNNYLEENHLVDFNDMLRKAVEAIKKSPVSYKWLFLDEGHDTSMLQYDLIEQIQVDHAWGVFSPHQMIYRWNGADEKNMQRFKVGYSPKEFPLLNNWRSNQEVVDLLEKVYPDKLIPKNTTPGQVVTIRTTEVDLLGDIVEILYGETDVEILARTNAQLPKKTKCNSSYPHSDYLPNLPGLRIGTFHWSKGTEATTVILLGCGDRYSPFYRSSDTEEERNLLYVALSRAKTNLYLLYEDLLTPFLDIQTKEDLSYANC